MFSLTVISWAALIIAAVALIGAAIIFRFIKRFIWIAKILIILGILNFIFAFMPVGMLFSTAAMF